MKKVKEPAPHEKAAQIEKEAVRALSVDEVEEALTKSTYGGAREEDAVSDVQTWESVQKGNERLREENFELVNRIYEQDQQRKDMEILKTECLDLKEENKKYLREIDGYKKTISKMKQQHEAEVQDLKDQLGETQAALAVAEKSKTEACRERNELIDAAADDDDRFQEILALAVVLERGARSMQELSRMLQEKTER